METPSSTRRVTRTQTSSASNNKPTSRKKKEEDEKGGVPRSKQGKSDQPALIDTTNDSPIIGLAAGSLKPPSSMAMNRGRAKRTPVSGEALLRGQVKALLQKVEEEGEFLPLSFNQRSLPNFQALLNSPTGLLAPTPANSPLTDLLDGVENLMSTVIPIDEVQQKEVSKMTQAPIESLKQEPVGFLEDLVTRALLFDSPDKSETSISSSSVLTHEDGDASFWSVQANASSRKDEEEEEEEEGGQTIDGLCDWLRQMCVEEKKKGIITSEFKGRHTRFIYNDKDEIETAEEVKGNAGVVVVVDCCCSVSPSVVCLKGMPVPEGKHLRFSEEGEED